MTSQTALYSTTGISAFTLSLIGGAVLYLPRYLFSSHTSAMEVLHGPAAAALAGSTTVHVSWLAEQFPFLKSAAASVLGDSPLAAVFNAALSSASATGLSALLATFAGLWAVATYLGDVSIVDSFWSLGFLLSAWIYNQHPEAASGFFGRKQLILGCVATWAVRLSGYIAWRNHGQGEDYRYKAMRKAMGPKFWWVSLFSVFGLQAVLCWIISQPLLAAQTSGPHHFTWQDVIGFLVWLTGFLFEAVGDLQLACFKSQPQNKGKLLTTGLWRYTRHPNYFGNAAMFWGFWMMAAATRGGKWTVYSPALMTFLLLKVSGVALLERGLKRSKPGFESYISSTSSFWPWFPAKKSC